MEFDKFFQWLGMNFQKSQTIKTLGGNKLFKARIDDGGNQIFFEYGDKGSSGYLSVNKTKLVWDRYMSLGGKKHAASEYTDPIWEKPPNRVLSPYAAALIRDFENGFQTQ